MTDQNNMDEFEDHFDDVVEETPQAAPQGFKESLLDAWRNKPIVKLFVIMAVVAFAMAGALGAFSGGSGPKDVSRLAKAPELNEVPGGQSSPFFIEQNKQANDQRVDQAIQRGGSAMPTPVGNNVDLSELTEKTKKDPLLEFRAETERLKQELRAEQRQSAQQVQVLQQQVQQQKFAPQNDDTLGRAMQKQMQDLMQSWTPSRLTMVSGVALSELSESRSLVARGDGAGPVEVSRTGTISDGGARLLTETPKALVPAGTVNYAQLLTEANSDVPGPILAQILSGPLAGGRAIGQFQVQNEYLVLTFSRVSYKGKDYSVNAVALDPDTTLGGMATEVDHRYLTRLLLPAAASFMSEFGSTIAQGSSSTTVSGDTLVVSQADRGSKDALYAGLGKIGQTMGQFFQSEANATKTLVRVAVGTPMGLFFLQPVQESGGWDAQNQAGTASPSFQELLAQSYQQRNAAAQQQLYPSQAYQTGTYPMTGSGYPLPSGIRTLTPNDVYNAGTTTIYGR